MTTGTYLAIRKSLLEGHREISVFPLTKLIMDVPIFSYVEFVKELPRNPNGKVMKKELRYLPGKKG